MPSNLNYYKLPDFISFSKENGYVCHCEHCCSGKTFHNLTELETHLLNYKFDIIKLDKLNDNLIKYILCSECNKYSNEKCVCWNS